MPYYNTESSIGMFCSNNKNIYIIKCNFRNLL